MPGSLSGKENDDYCRGTGHGKPTRNPAACNGGFFGDHDLRVADHVGHVVVDGAARGQGIGEVLTVEALRLAEAAGARTVDLTSRASREAAGRLYERVGFKSRETRFYRYAFADVVASPAS